jgi:hypothetical protein
MHTTLLITISGTQRGIDLEAPGDITIGALLATLLELCEPQPLPHALNNVAAWGLGSIDNSQPLPATASLIGAGITDGAILLLQPMDYWVSRRGQMPTAVPPVLAAGPHHPGVIWNQNGLLS